MGLKSWIIWKGKNSVYGFLCKFLWPRASAASLVVDNGKLLVIDIGDYLMLPGGALEYGETFAEAAERETLEETGFKTNITQKLHEGVNSVGGVEVLYRAELQGKDPVHSGNWEGNPIWIKTEEIGDRTWRHDRDVETMLDGKQS